MLLNMMLSCHPLDHVVLAALERYKENESYRLICSGSGNDQDKATYPLAHDTDQHPFSRFKKRIRTIDKWTETIDGNDN